MNRNQILIEKLPLTIIEETYKTNKKKTKIGNYQVKTKDDRYLNFITNGFECAKCGALGEYVNLECCSRLGNHLNVYAIKNGQPLLLTKDHIYPKSKGGLDDVKNYQVLCEECNTNKSDNSPITLVSALRNGQATKASVERAVKLHKPRALVGV